MKARHYEFTDKEWELIRPHIPISHTGRPQKDILMLVMKYHELSSAFQMYGICYIKSSIGWGVAVFKGGSSMPKLLYRSKECNSVLINAHELR